MDEMFNTIESRFKQDITAENEHRILLNGNWHDVINVPGSPTGEKRREVTDFLRDAGKHRPHFYA